MGSDDRYHRGGYDGYPRAWKSGKNTRPCSNRCQSPFENVKFEGRKCPSQGTGWNKAGSSNVWPRVYRSRMLDSIKIHRIGVLPLDNWSANREAGRILLNLLILRLANKELSNVTEPADLREIMIAEGIRSFDELDPNQIKKLQEKLNTRLFVGGTIYKYSEGLGAYGATSPEVEINLTMLDAETGRIVWSSNHTRKGQSYMTFFEFGLIRNSVSLADQVLEEMIATMKITRHK